MANLISIDQPIKRIITCQGSIQLMAALSAMTFRDQQQPNSSIKYENYLVIYELYSPDKQHLAFAEFITKIAESFCSWTKIIYLSPDLVDSFFQRINSNSPKKLYQSVYDLIGVESANEIYLCRNWQFTNSLLLNAYESATKICYGDGIGLYFSENSAVSRQPDFQLKIDGFIDWLGWKFHGLEQRFRKAFNLKTTLKQIQFDIGYFVLPDIFGEVPPMPTIILDRSNLLNIFRRFTHLLDTNYVSSLKQETSNSSISILLTSNLSEAKRLSQQDEIFAYREFLISHGIRSNNVLLIKPHPRDDIHKIQLLKAELSDLYQKVIIIEQPELFFLPFEILFLQTFSEILSSVEIRVFAVSSACLSLKLLFDVPSFIGFGDELTLRLFDPDYAEARSEHEKILLQAIARLDSDYQTQALQ